MTQLLSPREDKVLELACQGLTDKEIGFQLGISLTTVVTYWGRIRQKLGQRPRAELAAEFARLKVEREVEDLQRRLSYYREERARLERDCGTLNDFIDLAPDAMLFVSRDGTIIRANQAAADELDATQDQLTGSCIERLMLPEARISHDDYRARFFDEPARREMAHGLTVPCLTFSGKQRFVRIAMSHTTRGVEEIAIVSLRFFEGTDRARPIQ